ncbi:TPA: HK97 family phage prohead protease [Pseudomonas aeruginosa]|uniref:HK97 family phage prohead protease n=1 Tax=Pseudomonas aeruginosa TaxID=287 RepID=UPI002448F0CC|nr:HK97 family phage prohead protease [Pseudomonas aeruginosa]MDG9819427.1 HK97 family phage prohead protease [Pseudomonas aeruginosa]MDG9932418.1 HK97 family phage prohead protease [Pseudomonas aeruginosa]MDH0527955.1 HK97 family phage prohead protease [Pseudomonas aeruginosa]MDH0534618.1 HK97 family phage prohead protease [Pseudomonas aeruginosa]HBO8903674.1 HK97 family phage prohead protease [Pseudomonas aeruginosa]
MERRAAASLKHNGRTLFGYAARFGEPTPIEGFTEIIQPGAFSRSLAGPAAASIRAVYEHKDAALLGRVGAGTLRLTEDDVGLAFELDLPDTTVGRDVAELVKRGDVAGCSFGFVSGSERWEGATRHLLDVDLHEVTITASPAYPSTTVQVRSKEPRGLRLARLYLECLQ